MSNTPEPAKALWLDPLIHPPDPGQKILAYHRNGQIILTMMGSGKKIGYPPYDDYRWTVSGDCLGRDILRWMPLPEKPQI